LDQRPVIFINYRATDDPSAAVLLYQELTTLLGEHSVFLDYRSIALGQDFEPALLNSLRGCAVLLVVIGRSWCAVDESGNRLIDNPDDWVRREIIEAFTNGVAVVPVLIGDGPQLTTADLPVELTKLGKLQYAQIRHRHQTQDIKELIDNLVRQFPTVEYRTQPHAPAGNSNFFLGNLTSAQGVQVGEHNVQNNNF
jgi:hypothetical protein